jgi:hypothetical protein
MNPTQSNASRVVMLAMTAVAITACAAPGGASHSCSPDYVRENKLGRMGVQQRGPGSSVAWGAYPKLPATRYYVSVYAGARKVDGKNQSYPPHGKVPGTKYRSGQTFKVEGKSVDAKGGVVQTFFIRCTLA